MSLATGPRLIQGRFPGGQPTIIKPKPAISTLQQAAHVQEAVHRGAPQFYHLAGQRKAIAQAPSPVEAAGLLRRDGATLLPATFSFAPSIGQPMPRALQRRMEAFFRADFSEVRVHVGPQAAQIGAEAFTRGSDIFFAPGHYLPHHSHGQRLLGHELAHVLQQRAGRVKSPFSSGVVVVQDPGLEAEADRWALRAVKAVVQRMKGPPKFSFGMQEGNITSTAEWESGWNVFTDVEYAPQMGSPEALFKTKNIKTPKKLQGFTNEESQHAEDVLLPALYKWIKENAEDLETEMWSTLEIGINVSPCTTVSRKGLPATSGKVFEYGCAEKIIMALQGKFVHGHKTRHLDTDLIPMINLYIEHLYTPKGINKRDAKLASALALVEIERTGKIQGIYFNNQEDQNLYNEVYEKAMGF